MKLLNRRSVRMPYGYIRKANTLRNNSTKNDWEHWTHYREQIKHVIEATLEQYQVKHNHIVLLGAGNGNDVPISYLESVFERITIVDIDEQALDRLIARSIHPDKFVKAVIDLTGFAKEISTLTDLKANINTIVPNADLSLLEAPVDIVMNLCFTTQLMSAYFYRDKQSQSITTKFSSELDHLIEKIHISLFARISNLLDQDGVVIHLTDTLLLQTFKNDSYIRPVTRKADNILEGDRKRNIGRLYEHLSEFAREGLCLPGAFVHFHPDILKLYEIRKHHSLLWEFVHDTYEDRDYYVTAHVLGKI